MSLEAQAIAAESFRQVLSHGPYEKIDRLIEIVGREDCQICECLVRDARLEYPGLLILPPFFRSPETVYSHYSFWKIISVMPEKPLWFYHMESFGLSGMKSDEEFRFPPALALCPSLKTLILKDLGLTELPEALWTMRKLRILDVSGNSLNRIDKGIGRLRQLVYFNAADNELEELPPQAGYLRKLQVLNLSGNRIGELGFPLDSLVMLKKLNLAGNCLESLPPGLHSLIQLENVQLAYNDLSAEDEAAWEQGICSRIPSYQWYFQFEDNTPAIS